MVTLPFAVEKTAREIVDAAYTVHSTLGPGLLESVYETCMIHELRKRDLSVRKQVPFSVIYNGIRLEAGFRLDLLVADTVVLELKAVEAMHPVYKAQLLTYLKLTGLHLGFLINFNVPRIRDGINRMIR